MMTLPEFVEKYNIEISTKEISKRTDGINWGSNHWLVTLSRGNQSMQFQFSGGEAVTSINVCDCLDSIKLDYTLHLDNYEYAHNDPLILKNARELKRVIGKHLFYKLLWEVEPY